jgi:hypothetical protein
MCRGSRTPTRETRRVRGKRVPGRASDQHPLHQTRRRPATAAPVPGTRRSVPRPSPLPALVAVCFQVHPTVDVPGLSPRTEVSSADSEAQAAHPLSPCRTRTRRRPTVFAPVVGPILLDVEISPTSLPACSVAGNPAASQPGRRSSVPDHDLPPFGTRFDFRPLNGSCRCPLVAANDPPEGSSEICSTPSSSVSESLDPHLRLGPGSRHWPPPDCCRRKMSFAPNGPPAGGAVTRSTVRNLSLRWLMPAAL